MKRNSILLVAMVIALALAMPLGIAAQVVTAPRAQLFRGSGVWLGVSVSEVTAENMKDLKLKEERGVEVVTVTADGPAQKAGIKEKDAILEFNGARVESVEQFKRMISETPNGRTVKLLVSRDGTPQTISVKLEERASTIHRDGEHIFTYNMPTPPTPPTPPTARTAPAPRTPRAPRALIPGWDGDFERAFESFAVFGNSPRLGIEGEEIGSQLGEFFGVSEKGGVLVREVNSGSAAEKAGIKAGDVITKVDGKKIQDMSALREAIRDNAGKSFPITLVRNKKETTVTVKVEKTEVRRSGDHV